jgi:hypothetical protein
MEFRNIQRLEVVIGGLDFRTFDNREAYGNEDVFDFLKDLADEMARANGPRSAG